MKQPEFCPRCDASVDESVFEDGFGHCRACGCEFEEIRGDEPVCTSGWWRGWKKVEKILLQEREWDDPGQLNFWLYLAYRLGWALFYGGCAWLAGFAHGFLYLEKSLGL